MIKISNYKLLENKEIKTNSQTSANRKTEIKMLSKNKTQEAEIFPCDLESINNELDNDFSIN